MKRGIVGVLTKIALVSVVLSVVGGCAVYAEPGYYGRPYHHGYGHGYYGGGYGGGYYR